MSAALHCSHDGALPAGTNDELLELPGATRSFRYCAWNGGQPISTMAS